MIGQANWAGGDIQIRNHAGEIEIKSRIGDIVPENITGPVIANSTSGNVDITFSELSTANPTSITLVSGYIDISMPAKTSTDLDIISITGEIYTDLDIQLQGEKEAMRRLGDGRKIEGILNGGGTDMTLNTVSGDIYLRRSN